MEQNQDFKYLDGGDYPFIDYATAEALWNSKAAGMTKAELADLQEYFKNNPMQYVGTRRFGEFITKDSSKVNKENNET